ncbi:MAG: PilZ domain-containing protein [Acidobacteria bacterium]|nr:PilZ domain-containing protein [Acidobacteriota bacterium]
MVKTSFDRRHDLGEKMKGPPQVTGVREGAVIREFIYDLPPKEDGDVAELVLPLSWRLDKRREFPRAHVKTAWARFARLGRTALFDVSRGGVSIETTEMLSVGVAVNAQLLMEGSAMDVEAQVRHVTRIAAARIYRIGLRFIDLRPEFEARIDSVVQANLGCL